MVIALCIRINFLNTLCFSFPFKLLQQQLHRSLGCCPGCGLASNLRRPCCRGSLIQIKENRIGMQTLIFLYIVGVNIFQAAGNENSYQMYYRNLSIEKDAFDNLTAILASFVFDNSEVVVNITITTVCANANSGELCSCTQGYKWSDRVCKDNPTCCGSDPCVFTQNQQPQMCISNSTVYITGSITLPTNFTSCLAEHNTKIGRAHV